jgi:hypothetical protein
MTATEVAARDKHRQTMEALARANRIRSACTALKREVYDGTTTIAEAMVDFDRLPAAFTIEALLCAQRRWGGARARRALACAAVNPARPVRDLTERQRDVIVAVLP